MAAFCKGSGVGKFGDVGSERRSHVGGRTQLLEDADRKCGQLIFERAVRRNSRNPEAVGRRCRKKQRRAVYLPSRVTKTKLVDQSEGKQMNVVADNRLRERVLRSQRRCSADRAASIGKRGHRFRKILEIRIARKHLVPFSEAMVYANVELILIVWFVAKRSEVVGKSR